MATYICKRKGGAYYKRRMWKFGETIEYPTLPNKHFELESDMKNRLREKLALANSGGGESTVSEAPKTLKELSDENEKLEKDTQPRDAEKLAEGGKGPLAESHTDEGEINIFK